MGSPDSIESIVRVQAKKTTGGYTLFINIPKVIEKEMGLAKGDFLLIKIKGNKMIIKKLK